jgi:hypothetical protein
MPTNGYLHSDYASSLNKFGAPIELHHSRGWALLREIDGFYYKDASGCYPFFTCEDWSKLSEDIDTLAQDCICFSMVTDPFGDFDPEKLHEIFRDVFFPFKKHYVVDLNLPAEEIGGKRRRKHARRALKDVQIEIIDNPVGFIDEWVNLYDILIKKHRIKGLRAFSRESFLKQLGIPDTVVMRADYQGTTVGAQICYLQGDVAHIHLGAVSEKGYELEATYALDWTAFEYYKNKARWVNLGGGVGDSENEEDGLSQYKLAWASDTRMTYFCGRIFDNDKYEEVIKRKAIKPTNYFPAYRQGEYG